MKYLNKYELFENYGKKLYLLTIQGWMFDDRGNFSWEDYISAFETIEDLENSFINEMNDVYDKMMVSDKTPDSLKDNYKDIILDTYQKCKTLFADFNEEIQYDESEWNLYISIIEPLKNVKIRDDVKMKIDAKKYNL
jgi:hypothetical protein